MNKETKISKSTYLLLVVAAALLLLAKEVKTIDRLVPPSNQEAKARIDEPATKQKDTEINPSDSKNTFQGALTHLFSH
ncbi:hypothetical protein [Paraburkholderia tropica]|uniref:hypothetical protein n=1 Tax=Paraburkholderia tropica TaxID=92647 RepID=UPI003D2B2727